MDLIFYSILVPTLNVVEHVDTNLMTPDELASLTPQSVKDRTYGSKMVLVVEQSMIMTVWGCKGCLLLMYSKITLALRQHLAVKIVAAYVAVSLIVMEICYFGILAAILNKVSTFKDPYSSDWTFWYVREASTAFLVANLPNCWTLLRHLFNLRSFSGSSYGKGTGTRRTYMNGSTVLGSSVDPTKSATGRWNHNKRGGRSESQEDITTDGVSLQIWQQVQFTVDDTTDIESQNSGKQPTDYISGGERTKTEVTVTARAIAEPVATTPGSEH
ncbi:MAG: hypothetical protein M1834_001999 [Cirrosporium novae-zelandiae]|nr:MAG: hypothetical protein M1834_001999 [Cirrosporium novae-zelandiae]